MHLHAPLLALLLALAPAPSAQIAPTAPKAPVPLADYLAIRRVQGASFSHDEARVAYLSDEGGRLDVWVQPVAGGKPAQLTHVQGVIHAFAFSPVADALLYEADTGGNDETRLYLTPVPEKTAGKAHRELTPGLPAGSRAGFLAWSRDGRSFLFITNRPGEDFTEIHQRDLERGETTTLWKSPANLSFSLASPDFQRAVFQEILSDVDFNLYLFERGAREPVLLTPHEGAVAYTPTSFSPDGGTLYYTATDGGEYTALHALDLKSRTSRVVHRRDWDVETGAVSRGGRYLTTVTNADGTPEVEVRELATGKPIPLPRPSLGGAFVPVAFSASDRYLAATLVTDTSPETLYLIDLSRGTARPLAEALPASLRERRMAAGRAVRVRSFDGREIPALLYQPEGAGPFPAVLDIHGGPNSQAKRRFSGIRQYLVSKGYAVLVPNVRGSTGYGKTYTSLDDLDLGGGPLKDVLACKRWLIDNAKADKDRVAILGASYGGYMSLAAAAFAPGELAAHVDYFGISDLKSLVESYPPYWKVYSPFTFKKYGDPANPEHARYQRERSPVHFTDRIVGPLLVVQGENDKRVRRDQSDRLVAALAGRGVPVHYLVLPGEGHGFSTNESRLKAYEATDRFLDRYLFGDASAKVLP
jgi:dipeptidyl aminopeptidase/acylaminoacyl peptidase